MSQEAIFDRENQYLNANIRSRDDNKILYTLGTINVHGHHHEIESTALSSINESGVPNVLGLIQWRERTVEIGGVKKRVDDLRALKGNIWRWDPNSTGYSVEYDSHSKTWKAFAVEGPDSIKNPTPTVEFITYHDKKPAVLRFNPSSSSDSNTRAFLILVLILEQQLRHPHPSTVQKVLGALALGRHGDA